MDYIGSLLNPLLQQATLVARDPLCNPGAISLPELKGLEILAVDAVPTLNYTFPADSGLEARDDVFGGNFCNVTVTYTHPGWGDTITVTTYLPFQEEWNERFIATGGGGLVTGGEHFALILMAPHLAKGFAVSTTDGGHASSPAEAMASDISWPHSSPGNVNWPLLMDFASVALHDMSIVGKAVVKAFYGSDPKYSYFFGASTGGRQGHILAQRYPHDFDGIIALCPAINWHKFLFSNIYPGMLMGHKQVYPRACEMEAFRQAAVAACDPLDGLKDGIISRPDLCQFDPRSVIGRGFECDGTPSTFSSDAAEIARAAWQGPRSATGEFQWYGFGVDADISTPGVGSASTICTSESQCSPARFIISDLWIRYWVKKDASFDVSSVSHEEWDAIFHSSVNEYSSIIGTVDPDLSAFRRAGGKMLNWHGMADQVIPVSGSVDYYKQVLEKDPNAQDYYRLYLAPGATHSLVGHVVPETGEVMSALQDWVENSIAPDTLRATGPAPFQPEITFERDLCMYPRVQHYRGGDETSSDSFICE
ncbi:Tannase/feruloyl esterase [Dactylonectria macrodidyma]|uniref:Carboxylic ester hydrolase n=1 Tax=Dactylonectria macrodidyma TaxID=307937 RepID=A0A9P9EFM0_9HYPO|nr:Tannase/feruloyl esterase [Dactylonectria macrodidyma]